MEILSFLWTVLSFFLGLIWSFVWFILRDLLSTLLWILIAVWLVLSVRYRSFTAGTVAMLRYGRYGFGVFWRWLRGRPQPLAGSNPIIKEKIKIVKGKRFVPFGYMSVSEQLNMLLVAALYLLFFA